MAKRLTTSVRAAVDAHLREAAVRMSKRLRPRQNFTPFHLPSSPRMLPIFVLTVLVGIGATLTLDIWALLLKALFGLPTPPWHLIGRWFAYMPHGRFVHRQGIGASTPVAHELAIGWTMHYAVGIIFTFAVLVLAGSDWLQRPTFAPALTVGLVTVLCGWLLLQPGIGIGIAGSKTPKPNLGRALNIVGHIVFALGMWASALLLGNTLAS